MQGKHTDAKYHDKLEAAKLITRYGSSDEDGPHFWGILPTPEELAASPSHHSRAACPRLRSGSGNPEGQGAGGIDTPSTSTGEEPAPSESRGWDGGEELQPPTTDPYNEEINYIDDKPDYYIESPAPEVQAAFDHEMRIETGGYPEEEIPDEPPPPATVCPSSQTRSPKDSSGQPSTARKRLLVLVPLASGAIIAAPV